MEDKLEEIKEQHNLDMLGIAKDMINNENAECNQCHSNCNDCGYDR